MSTISALNTATTASTSSASSSTGASAGVNTSEMQDRFLKLLVAQLNNQDPMNPMDNAQMTSQMAQINTVTGIQQVNETLKNMSMLQSTSMVGRDVLIEGNSLSINKGVAAGAVDLPASATSVKINILSPSKQVVGTVDLGAQDAGRHAFEWDASQYTGAKPLSFEAVAVNGNQVVTPSSLVRDQVMSVGSDGGNMTVQLLGHSTVAYSAVKAIL
jgi:flagellar basal-body rod modification protein FlgD